LFHIGLYQPEIPQNTGNIVRLSVGSGCQVHLIPPLGFSLADRYLKRAGLDYWQYARVTVENNLEELLSRFPREKIHLFSKRGRKLYWEVEYAAGDLLLFGRECCGLPPETMAKYSGQIVTIPQLGPIRSHNLANSVALGVYEGLRQLWIRGEMDVNFNIHHQ
jgi:tRNA (cytidine/uridine-2'-O-)-methyltransferase